MIQGDHLIQVARNTVQRIRSPVLIRTDAWSQIETFISGIWMICENKQGNQWLISLFIFANHENTGNYCCALCVTLFGTVWTPCDRLIQVKTIEKVSLVGTS